jgi:cell wall-associated NlpC family hydrolase
MGVRIRSVAAIGIVAVLGAGCGQRQTTNGSGSSPVRASASGASQAASQVTVPHAHPQVVQPVAGATIASGGGAGSSSAAPAAVSVGPPSGGLAEPVSDAEIRRELAASGLSANARQATLTTNGLAIAPIDAPASVQAVIQAGNEIAHLPYVWGGGHARYIDTGYDCSGSLSFVLGAGGILNTTMTSGQLANWGDPGPGKWITIFANNGHTFMYIAGLRFDTVALAQTGTRWSNRSANEPDLSTFAIRHPPGL